ncbi:MAG: YaeQ family protein [Turneriella sp.]
MAIKSTIFKADVEISDTDRDYYEKHKLTLARHPSETDERLMVRLLVFTMHAQEYLEFAGGISTEDTPALWRKNLSGEILEWIEIGHPDEKRLRKACGRARQVYVYCFGSARSRPWWQSLRSSLDRFGNVSVRYLSDEQIAPLSLMAKRTMQLTCIVQDGEFTLSDNDRSAAVTPERWLESRSGK